MSRNPRLPRRTRDRPCDDCGHTIAPTRGVTFWATGMRYVVCAAHEREYRGMGILLDRAWKP